MERTREHVSRRETRRAHLVTLPHGRQKAAARMRRKSVPLQGSKSATPVPSSFTSRHFTMRILTSKSSSRKSLSSTAFTDTTNSSQDLSLSITRSTTRRSSSATPVMTGQPSATKRQSGFARMAPETVSGSSYRWRRWTLLFATQSTARSTGIAITVATTVLGLAEKFRHSLFTCFLCVPVCMLLRSIFPHFSSPFILQHI